MGDIQRRADDEALDKKVERRISNINQAVERGVKGEALAALHGLHVPPDNETPCDMMTGVTWTIKRPSAAKSLAD